MSGYGEPEPGGSDRPAADRGARIPAARLRTRVRSALADLAQRGGLSGLVRRRRERCLVILAYHRVLPADQAARYPFPDLVVTPEALDAHVRWCSRYYSCVPLREAVERWDQPASGSRPLLVFSFDDGYWDNAVHATPVLEAHGVRATFFVISSLVGSDAAPWYDALARAVDHLRARAAAGQRVELERPGAELAGGAAGVLRGARDVVQAAKRLAPARRDAALRAIVSAAAAAGLASGGRDRVMTPEQLRALAAAGHEIGSHTRTHPLLPQLGPLALEDELEGARRELSELSGTCVVSLAYPNGDCDGRVRAAAVRAGYRQAVTMRRGLNELDQNRLALERVPVSQQRLSRADGSPSPGLLELELTGLAGAVFLRSARGVAP
jgi:peptidoglycan/xylan/chitin deacetylase (PgdA/CDA1 family)